jgi:HK97 family phage portal protein
MVGLTNFVPRFRNWMSRRLLPEVGVHTARSGIGDGIIAADAATTALSSAAVWACLRLVSQSIAALPAHVFEETPEGKIKAFKHPYYRMLTKEPNALMTMSQWVQMTVLHLLIYGNAFSIPGQVDGELVSLWPLDPTRVRIDWKQDGSFTYKYFDTLGTVQEFQPLDLLHFRIFSLDGLIGLSPLDYHRLTFDAEFMAHSYAAGIWKNGGRPSGVLEYPGNLRKEQVEAIRESWQWIHGGPEGAGRVAVLDGGTKYNPISVPLQQLEYIAQQKFSVEQIARIYGVPPHMIGAADKPTYASVEQQALEFSQYTQQPIVIGLEETIQTRLLEPPYFYRFNLSAFARADIATRYRAYATGRQWGWLSVNDIRESEDMNRIGLEGDVYLQPLNMIPAQPADEAQVNFAPIPPIPAGGAATGVPQ